MFGQYFLTSLLWANRPTATVCVLFQDSGDCWYLKATRARLRLIYAARLFDIDRKR